MIDQLKKELVEVARTAYMRGLTAGWGGNVSIRVDDNSILITPHKKSLAFIGEEDLLLIDLQGYIKEGSGIISTESKMHLSLYETHDYKAIIHLHPPAVNSVINCGKKLKLSTYESELTLGGTPPVLPQTGPTVTDTTSLVKAFETTSVAILEKHGIVTAGDTIYEAFALADVLEEAAKVTINSAILAGHKSDDTKEQEQDVPVYPVFSEPHLKKLQTLINEDEATQNLGKQTDLTVKYAIKQLEDGLIYNMHFVKGRLEKITHDEDADFINVGKKEIWIHVFNGRLDPFAATSQKKLRLIKGHIGDLSKWYAPFYRIFDLWKFAPVEELHND